MILAEEEARVDLQYLLHEIYDQGSYDLRIDYNSEPVPPLSEVEKAWVDELLKKQGLRSAICQLSDPLKPSNPPLGNRTTISYPVQSKTRLN